VRRATNLSVEHPIFGWVTGTITQAMREHSSLVLSQLRLLWAPAFVRQIFSGVLALAGEKMDAKADAKTVGV
jgi:hypothetical protein